MPEITNYVDPFTLSPDERAATFDARMAYANSVRLAPHGTDWFATARAQIELENALDGQIGFGK